MKKQAIWPNDIKGSLLGAGRKFDGYGNLVILFYK